MTSKRLQRWRERVMLFLEAGVDRTTAAPGYLRQVRMVSFNTVLMFTIAIPFVFRYLSLGIWLIAVGLLVTMIGCVVNISILRRTHNPVVSGHVAATLLFLLLVMSNVVSGGFYDANFSWLYILPLGAALLVNLRAGWIWTAIVVLTTLVFWLLPGLGVEVPNLIPPDEHAVQSLLNRISAILAIAILTTGFVVVERRTERSLQAANSALAKEVEERKRAESEARAADRAKSAFLATVSHELRTPMNGVIGMTGILLDTDLDEDQRSYANTVRVSAESLLTLINEVLDFEKIESGTLALEPIDFDLDDALAEMIELLSPIAGEKGLALIWRRAPEVPKRVRSDLGRLRQILINLIGNALKYTEKGSVHVLIEAAEEHQATQPGQLVAFRVVDTGIGIPSELVQQLFRPFTQADDSPTRRFGGTGLGLAIASQLCELMGGAIDVTSKQGMGSTFRFTVRLTAPRGEPAADAAQSVPEMPRPSILAIDVPAVARAPLPEKNARSAAEQNAYQPPTPSGRVLIVEDNAINQRVLAAMLEKLGYLSDVAANGREAVGMLETIAYQAVLMDCWMPVLDGYQATREIRLRETGPERIPIIALTGSALPDERDRAKQAGMDDFVTKPITLETMRKVLAHWRVKPTAPSASAANP